MNTDAIRYDRIKALREEHGYTLRYVADLTEGVYTHVSHDDLMEDMIKITDMFL